MVILKEFRDLSFVEKINREENRFPMIFESIGEKYEDILNSDRSFSLFINTLTEHLLTEAVIFFIEKDHGLHSDSYFTDAIKLKPESVVLLHNYISKLLLLTKNIYGVDNFDKRDNYPDGIYRKTIDDVLEILDLNINKYIEVLEELNKSIHDQYFKGKRYMKKFILDKISSTISEYMKQYINNKNVNDIIDDHRDMILLTY